MKIKKYVSILLISSIVLGNTLPSFAVENIEDIAIENLLNDNEYQNYSEEVTEEEVQEEDFTEFVEEEVNENQQDYDDVGDVLVQENENQENEIGAVEQNGNEENNIENISDNEPQDETYDIEGEGEMIDEGEINEEIEDIIEEEPINEEEYEEGPVCNEEDITLEPTARSREGEEELDIIYPEEPEEDPVEEVIEEEPEEEYEEEYEEEIEEPEFFEEPEEEIIASESELDNFDIENNFYEEFEEEEEVNEEPEQFEEENIASESEVDTQDIEDINISSDSEASDINIDEEIIATESEIEEFYEEEIATGSNMLLFSMPLLGLLGNPPAHTHFACGCEIGNLGEASEEDECNEHNVSEKITYELIDSSNINLLNEDSIYNYVLGSDITIDTAYPSNKNELNICLNGHNINFAQGLNFMTLDGEGVINICDCQNHSGTIKYDSDAASSDGSTFTVNKGSINLYGVDIEADIDDTTNKISLINVGGEGKLNTYDMVIKNSSINKQMIAPTSAGASGISPLINVVSDNTNSHIYMKNTEIKNNNISGQPLISLGGKAEFLLENTNIHNNDFEKACIYINNTVESTIDGILVKDNTGSDPNASSYEGGAYACYISVFGDNTKTNIKSDAGDVLFENNTSTSKAQIGLYHGELNIYGDFKATNNTNTGNGGVFVIIGKAGKKNINFYGNVEVSNNTASRNTLLFQDFGGIYVGSDGYLYVHDNTANDTYMMTFVDGTSNGGGFLIDGEAKFYNNEGCGAADYGCIYLYSSNLEVNGKLTIDSYHTAGACGGIGVFYNSKIKGNNKNIILKNNRGLYTGGLFIAYTTQDNFTQELSDIIFENNEATGEGYHYIDNIYVCVWSGYKTLDMYIHDCEFEGNVGIYDSSSYKNFKFDNVKIKNVNRYSTGDPLIYLGVGTNFEFTNVEMSNVTAYSLLYAGYDYIENIKISNVKITSDSANNMNKFSYLMYLGSQDYSNTSNVTLENFTVENTLFDMPIINKDNTKPAKFDLSVKDIDIKNTYGPYGLFYLSNFDEGYAEFENINIENYTSSGNTNDYGVIDLENVTTTITNLTIDNVKEYTPKPMLGIYSGSNVEIDGDFSITNSTDVVSLIDVSGSDTVLTIDEPLTMTGNKMKSDSQYKSNNSICMDINNNAEVKLAGGANITNNNVETVGAVYINNAKLNIAGKVNIENNINANPTNAVNVYFADENSKIGFLEGYDKIDKDSSIYMTTNIINKTVFEYWNDDIIDGWESGEYYFPDNIFKVDKKQKNQGYQIYKYDIPDNVLLKLGTDYYKLTYKIEETGDTFATQYLAKNVKTYVDTIRYDDIPSDIQLWKGPDADDDTQTVEWQVGEQNEITLTADRIVLLKRPPRLNIKSHLDSKYFRLIDHIRYAGYNKTVSSLSNIQYESDCYEVYGWSYEPINESFDDENQARSDSRYVEGTIYTEDGDSDIYPMYHQLVAFVEYKNDDGSSLDMSNNNHLPKYIFTDQLSTQSIPSARRNNKIFLGWSGTDISDTPYKEGNIELYNITSIEKRTYVAHWKNAPSNNTHSGGSSKTIPVGMGDELRPGNITNNIDLPINISNVALNNLNENGINLVKNNKTVRDAVIDYPPNILAIRDLQNIINNNMSDTYIMNLIENSMQEYPETLTYAWDSNNKISYQKYVINDMKTNFDFDVNMNELSSQWSGKMIDGKLRWCYYKDDGSKLTNLYQNGDICYLFDENGIMLTGYQNVNGILLYFNETPGPNEGQLVLPKYESNTVSSLYGNTTMSKLGPYISLQKNISYNNVIIDLKTKNDIKNDKMLDKNLNNNFVWQDYGSFSNANMMGFTNTIYNLRK